MTSQTAPKIRHTVRALLFNPAGELLLFKYRNDPNIHNVGMPPLGSDYWGTIGGGMEEGEAEDIALRREIFEETGHTDIVIGPLVWHRKVDLVFYGAPLHVDEKYFVAHTADVDIDISNHTQIERKFVAETRWWSAADLAHTADLVLPRILPAEVDGLSRGIYPQQIQTIDV